MERYELTEKQLTKRATIDTFEEVYTNHDKAEDTNEYTFLYS